MERKDFLAAFAAAPLAFVEQKDIDNAQKEDTVVFLMNVGGETIGLGFKLDQFDKDNLMRTFEYLASSARQSFVEKVIFPSSL